MPDTVVFLSAAVALVVGRQLLRNAVVGRAKSYDEEVSTDVPPAALEEVLDETFACDPAYATSWDGKGTLLVTRRFDRPLDLVLGRGEELALTVEAVKLRSRVRIGGAATSDTAARLRDALASVGGTFEP